MTKKEIIRRVKSIIEDNELLLPQQKVVVAVSGGADSLALLHLLTDIDLALSLTVVYVNHGLRPLEIPIEINLVAEHAEILGAEFRSITVDVTGYQKAQNASPEEAARVLRYQALHQVCRDTKAQHLAVAHTADDQVEEFLLRMLRGSGRQGLAAMSFKRDTIIRPLLTTTKTELLDYLRQKGVSHCEDSSNQERFYLRNRVRLDLIPFLKQYNPSIQQTILNISDVLREEDNFLEQETNQLRSQATQEVGTREKDHKVVIDCQQFLSGHKALQRRLVEQICWQLKNTPSFTQIETLRLLAQTGQNGKIIPLAKGLRVEKQHNSLVFSYPFGHDSTTRQKSPQRPLLDCTIEGIGRYRFPEIGKELVIEKGDNNGERSLSSLIVDSKTIQFPLTLRYHQAGEIFRPLGSPGTRKIGRFLTDKKIHGQNKIFFPVLAGSREEHKIIALLGLAIDDKHKITDSTAETFLLSWQDISSD